MLAVQVSDPETQGAFFEGLTPLGTVFAELNAQQSISRDGPGLSSRTFVQRCQAEFFEALNHQWS